MTHVYISYVFLLQVWKKIIKSPWYQWRILQSMSVPNFPIQKGQLQSSDRVTWNTADSLGRGATAVVYLAREKVKQNLLWYELLSIGLICNRVKWPIVTLSPIFCLFLLHWLILLSSLIVGLILSQWHYCGLLMQYYRKSEIVPSSIVAVLCHSTQLIVAVNFSFAVIWLGY